MWFQQQALIGITSIVVLAATPAWADVTTVTTVKLNPTNSGLEVILETSDQAAQILPTSFGKTFVANILNTQLRLENGESFRALNPAAGIASVTVTQQGANSIRVAVTGTETLPKVKFVPTNSGLVLNLNASPTTVKVSPQTPGTPAPETPAAQSEEETAPTTGSEDEADAANEQGEGEPDIEVVVTGEQENGYSVPNATTGTRTNTPLRDIPQSIQVVPRQVIEDQQIIRLDEALRNVAGVTGNSGEGVGFRFSIRGFERANILRDGFNLSSSDVAGETGIETFPETANLERIEVLKGPASILYGEINPGGVINLVTKKPLNEPFYEAEVQVGSRAFVRPRIDVSELLTDDGRLRYRLNALYQTDDGLRDFDQDIDRFFIAPVVSWKISDSLPFGNGFAERDSSASRTDLTLELEYLDDKRPYDTGLVAVVG